jgi:hypothetical protein
MALTDPQALTIGGATKNLVRVDSGKYQSEYYLAEATQSFRMFVRSSDLKVEADGRRKVRHNISLRQTIFATATTPEVVRSTSHTIEHYAGDLVTDYDDISLAVSSVATVANIAKLNNYES